MDDEPNVGLYRPDRTFTSLACRGAASLGGMHAANFARSGAFLYASSGVPKPPPDGVEITNTSPGFISA